MRVEVYRHTTRLRTRDPSGRRQAPNSCGKCGRSHAPSERCPAEGSMCNACSKLNHWQCVCCQATCRTSGVKWTQHSSGSQRSRTRPTRRANSDERQRGGVHSMTQNDRSDQLSDNFELLAFDNIAIKAVERDEAYATLRITLKDKPNTPATLRVKVDTGSQGNGMPLRTLQRMYPSDVDIEWLPTRGCLEHRDTTLTTYNGLTKLLVARTTEAVLEEIMLPGGSWRVPLGRRRRTHHQTRVSSARSTNIWLLKTYIYISFTILRYSPWRLPC